VGKAFTLILTKPIAAAVPIDTRINSRSKIISP